MISRVLLIALICVGLVVATFGAQQAPAAAGQPAPTSPGAGPVIVVETLKGIFEFETYPNEAPKTVARIVELVEAYPVLEGRVATLPRARLL